MSQSNAADSDPGRFATTCWTQVMAARGDSSECHAALSELCEHYYEPVLAYLRRAGDDRDGLARDLAHDFFADLLAGGRLNHLERDQGRFRSYLLGALKHFLSHHRARLGALKRGGKANSVSLNETGVEVREGAAMEDVKALPPDVWFDQQWARVLLERALTRVESECRAEGKATQFQHLSPWLTGEAEYGDQATLADRAGIPLNTLKSVIHRLRRRFRLAVKAEIARTLANREDIDNEMAALFAALGGGE